MTLLSLADEWSRFDVAATPHHVVEVNQVTHYTDRLFSFRTSRPASFRFRSGEFVMIGLPVAGKPLLRAYSIASPEWDEDLEFYSIKVADGPLTSRLQAIKPGDPLILGKKPTGTLVLDALDPGERLFFFSTGTGIAPFASLIRDPGSYERFREVVLVHGCRLTAELQYGYDIVAAAKADEIVGEAASAQLRHVPICTRETYPLMGRIPDLIENGRLFDGLGGLGLDPARDRAMICGSMAMLADLKALLERRGFTEGSNAKAGQFVIERAFVG